MTIYFSGNDTMDDRPATPADISPGTLVISFHFTPTIIILFSIMI